MSLKTNDQLNVIYAITGKIFGEIYIYAVQPCIWWEYNLHSVRNLLKTCLY